MTPWPMRWGLWHPPAPLPHSDGQRFTAAQTTSPLMPYYLLKVAVSALLVVAIAEIAKRSTTLAALLASLPLTSLLAFVWLHLDGESPEKIAQLSSQILWLVLPSLLLFLLLPVLLKHGLNFWLSLGLSTLATAAAYLALLPLLRRFGVNL